MSNVSRNQSLFTEYKEKGARDIRENTIAKDYRVVGGRSEKNLTKLNEKRKNTTEKQMRDMCVLFKKGMTIGEVTDLTGVSIGTAENYLLAIKRYLLGGDTSSRNVSQNFHKIMAEYFDPQVSKAKEPSATDKAEPEAVSVEVDPNIYARIQMGIGCLDETLQSIQEAICYHAEVDHGNADKINGNVETLGKCISLLIEEIGKLRKDMNANADNTQKELRELKSAIECGFRKVRR